MKEYGSIFMYYSKSSTGNPCINQSEIIRNGGRKWYSIQKTAKTYSFRVMFGFVTVWDRLKDENASRMEDQMIPSKGKLVLFPTYKLSTFIY